MPQPAAPIAVFCSFAPKDKRLCLDLERRLKHLHRQGLLTLWHRGHLPAGTDQASAVAAALTRATLILLLISPDYFSSDDCFEVELAHAMQRHEAGTARVIPILLRPIEDREATPFGQLAVLPTNEQPITLWSDRDQAFADVVAGIRRAISDLPASSLGPSPVPLPQVWTIPYLRNPVFTGREALLTHLARQLQAGQTMALQYHLDKKRGRFITGNPPPKDELAPAWVNG